MPPIELSLGDQRLRAKDAGAPPSYDGAAPMVYYRSRFEKLFDLSPEALADPVRQKASVLRLRNGYNAAADTMEITAVLQHGEGRPEWGAEPGKPCFILRILSVKSV